MRKRGQSQLDYLWDTFGEYFISNDISEDAKHSIPTQEFVLKLYQQSGGAIFEVVDNLPVLGFPNRIYLVPQGNNKYNAYVYIDNLAVLLCGTDKDVLDRLDAIENDIDEIKYTLTWKLY